MSPTTRRWFLPQSPDVLGMLRAQIEVTVRGIEAFESWARGETDAGVVRDAEHEADAEKRQLLLAIREAFTTPLDPEDLFELSRGLDEVMNGAKNTVREAEAMTLTPDKAMVHMAAAIGEGVRHLQAAFDALGGDETAATTAAEAAVKTQRRLERIYRVAMSERVADEDLRTVIGYQELYRRLMAISEALLLVADRVQYAIVKEA